MNDLELQLRVRRGLRVDPAGSYALLAAPVPDEDVPVIRELLSYDAVCEASCIFNRGSHGQLVPANAPSPLHWSRQAEWPWAVRAAALEPHHRVLDVGGSWAVLQYALARRCAEVVCLDPDVLSHVKAGRTAAAIGAGNIRRVVGDGRAIPFPDGSFDRVVCVSVLEHVGDDRDRFLDECLRVLRPGGVLVLSLDFVFEGPAGGESCVTMEEAAAVLDRFGLLVSAPESGCTLGAIMSGGQKISVVMIRWVKAGGAP